MKLRYSMGIVVTGVLLGACGGFSDLGEGVGQGGEGSMDGGTGGGGAVSGSQAMGGSTAMGGGTMTGGSTATGGSNPMGGTAGTACMVPDDCPPPPPVCNMCLNGVSACYHATCDAGVCGIARPECVENIPCRGRACGDACMRIATDAEEEAAAPAFPTACDAEGRCVDAAQALGCMIDPTPICMTAADCPSPGMMECITCNDGSTSCPGTACIEGLCTAEGATCEDDTPCLVNADCPELPPICLPCGDSCAGHACVNGGCEIMCDFGRECETTMDCPSQTPDNICTTGPWECVEGSCSLRHQDCSMPVPM